MLAVVRRLLKSAVMVKRHASSSECPCCDRLGIGRSHLSILGPHFAALTRQLSRLLNDPTQALLPDRPSPRFSARLPCLHKQALPHARAWQLNLIPVASLHKGERQANASIYGWQSFTPIVSPPYEPILSMKRVRESQVCPGGPPSIQPESTLSRQSTRKPLQQTPRIGPLPKSTVLLTLPNIRYTSKGWHIERPHGCERQQPPSRPLSCSMHPMSGHAPT